MDIDTKYPALSSLARSQGYTLKQIGKGAQNIPNRYLRLADCCEMALKDYPRWPSCDAYNYLATLDRFLMLTPEHPLSHQKIWRKLVGGSESIFLDTVVEAVWAIHFWDSGLAALLEQPLDPSNPISKDADLVVTLGETRYWLDALSIDMPSTPSHLIWRPTLEMRLMELVKRAQKKYDNKFRKAVKSGCLKMDSTGILLCIVKSEREIIPQFIGQFNENTESLIPSNVFNDNRPKLDLIWIHTIRPSKSSDVLEPISLQKWMRA